MQTQPGHGRQLRAALFVDFDNIYINLAQQDNQIAVQFATNVERWLNWLEQQMPCDYLAGHACARRILIRKCYLNPLAFTSFRPYFIRSAFEVVDCPPLTTRGKTSTDIHMVMDILEALNSPTFFDEFIILSGDADFTPVLLKLRKHDRMSVVMAAGYASPVYKAACDFLINPETFIKATAGVTGQETEQEAVPRDKALNGTAIQILRRIGARLYEAANLPEGVQAGELPAIFKEYPEFKNSEHWLGFYSLRHLTEAILAQRNDLEILEEDPWRVVVRRVDTRRIDTRRIDTRRESTRRESTRMEYPSTPVLLGLPLADSRPGPVSDSASRDVKREVAAYIRLIVEKATSAVPMATLAQVVNRQFADYKPNTNWFGAGTFKNLLKELDLGHLETSPATPGFVYDPQRHAPPVLDERLYLRAYSAQAGPQRGDEFATRYPDLAPLAQKIHRLTGTPYLTPEQYALLLHELAREVNEHGYQMTRTSKAVRDRCVEKSAPVARSHVNFVLIGIYSTGYRFGTEIPESAGRLGTALVTDIINLSYAAQLNLPDGEIAQIQEWITGSLEEITG